MGAGQGTPWAGRQSNNNNSNNKLKILFGNTSDEHNQAMIMMPPGKFFHPASKLFSFLSSSPLKPQIELPIRFFIKSGCQWVITKKAKYLVIHWYLGMRWEGCGGTLR
ncbi:hypothetical protein ILYODFUR_017908 [Ilyodon furcidens]|uniref:Uncharacterized protein n=1 Tax=Ilyodon furcidens TaxID=33524 RepID=A0ABV0TWS1_9TELE